MKQRAAFPTSITEVSRRLRQTFGMAIAVQLPHSTEIGAWHGRETKTRSLRPVWLRMLFGLALGLVVWASLAPLALAFGQVIIFRDPVLSNRYATMEKTSTKLQIQEAADKYSASMRGKRLTCRGLIQDVLPPDGTQTDPNACQVTIELTAVSGFTTPELPVVSYWVPRAKAVALKLKSPIAIAGTLYAIDRYGAVAVELEAPAGWKDPLGAAQPSTGGESTPTRGMR